jgi:RNA polymerase sigma factor (sigma-70 family)
MALVLDLPLIRATKARLHDGRREVTTLAPVIDLAARRKHVDELVADNVEWALQIASQKLHATTGNAGRDDAESAALEGLWKAARTWNGTGDFRGFAYVRVRGAVIDDYRKRTHRGRGVRTISLNHPSMLPVADVPDSAPDADIIEMDEIRALAKRAELTERQRDCVLQLASGKEPGELAREWGTTVSNVSQCLHVAARKLRVLAIAILVEGDAA